MRFFIDLITVFFIGFSATGFLTFSHVTALALQLPAILLLFFIMEFYDGVFKR